MRRPLRHHLYGNKPDFYRGIYEMDDSTGAVLVLGVRHRAREERNSGKTMKRSDGHGRALPDPRSQIGIAGSNGKASARGRRPETLCYNFISSKKCSTNLALNCSVEIADADEADGKNMAQRKADQLG